MKSRLFTVLAILAALTALAIGASAQGQGSRISELKRRVAEQVKSGAKMQTTKPVAEAEDKNDTISRGYPAKNALAGTWDLTLTFSDGSNVESTLQIMAGPADGEGSALHASIFSFAPPNPTLPEQGAWRYVRGSHFVASYYGYSYDEQFQPFGKIGFRHKIILGANQNEFMGEAVFEVIDLEGHVLFTDNVTTKGVRQRAVAP